MFVKKLILSPREVVKACTCDLEKTLSLMWLNLQNVCKRVDSNSEASCVGTHNASQDIITPTQKLSVIQDLDWLHYLTQIPLNDHHWNKKMFMNLL